MTDLHTSIAKAGPAYKLYAKRLEKLGLATLEDMLYHIPTRYKDYSTHVTIENLTPASIVTIQGTVDKIQSIFTKRSKRIQKATISDKTGSVDIMWFNQPYLAKLLKPGMTIAISGTVESIQKKMGFIAPDYEIVSSTPLLHTGRLVPVYPETRGVSSKWLRSHIFQLLTVYSDALPETLPASLTQKYHLLSFQKALMLIHFPKTLEEAQDAKKRLAFEEIFTLQLNALYRKQQWQNPQQGYTMPRDKVHKENTAFLSSLPFTLTTAQEKAVDEIFDDMKSSIPMNRLLQGDVGSGKTIVAAIAMYLSYLHGYKSLLMAPTEILATQHFETIKKLFRHLPLTVSLTTGSKKTHTASTDICIGTHALLSKTMSLEKIGLVVIDEQQRFGVQQRALLRQKGKTPHVLTMTATPIPRTIALTMYGDLAVSILDQMPHGRKQIKTWFVPKEKRQSAYQWIDTQIKETSSQAFLICPFIEESETMVTIKAAKKEFEILTKTIFPHYRIGLLHGKLKPKEKDDILAQFAQKELDILVATPVVEVGIDIANATIIVIEGADHFGLSQLHQLRGRVGRGEKQSYCLLFTESNTPQTIQRLHAMETIAHGLKLAEMDLSLRGAGDMYGTKQHGQLSLKFASFSNIDLIDNAKSEAQDLFPILDTIPSLYTKVIASFTPFITPD